MVVPKFCILLVVICVYSVSSSEENTSGNDYDPNGYIIFCLCMGRLGNQMEHFLGGLAFSKAINRTLILPPFRTYKNIPFNEWFEVESLKKYHRVILAEDFMRDVAPSVWLPGKRYGFCWRPSSAEKNCDMKNGNPFGPFWDGLGVNFDGDIVYTFSYSDIHSWPKNFPADAYPVIAMKGAPASFPMKADHRYLQKYVKFSDEIASEGQKYISDNFPNEKFVGIHLRNGDDWKHACDGAAGLRTFMASPQCLESTDQLVTSEICLPSLEEVLRATEIAVLETKATALYIATDKNPYKKQLQEHLQKYNVHFFHMDPWLPLTDVYILSQADKFIGNCVSSFTSFVKRTRDAHDLPSAFWGL